MLTLTQNCCSRFVFSHFSKTRLLTTTRNEEIYDIPKSMSGAHIDGENAYNTLYEKSLLNKAQDFWGEVGSTQVSWLRDFEQVKSGNISSGDTSWFVGGQLNASHNCIDRHIANGLAEKTALLWEGDDKQTRTWSFARLSKEVGQLANALRSRGVKKGDAVCIYMPMVPETVAAMLACARIGAVHSVVFAGFSAEALRDRINNAGCRVILTADEGVRGGKHISLKRTVDEALLGCRHPNDPNGVHSVIVLKRTGTKVPWAPSRDVDYHDALRRERTYSPFEYMDAEDPLFVLYTSGSTGQPKGLVHTTGGYLVQSSYSHKIIFDVRDDDVYACMADVGWITGHSYIVYGPLVNGCTTLLFESLPTFPDASRYWDVVERHRVTQFYTAPTAIRTLMKYGDEPVKAHDRSSLRLLGSVGEPINPEAWRWYYNVVGEQRCPIVDTYWQTETGSCMFTPLPGATPMKPGAAAKPFPGIAYDILEPESGKPAQRSENGRRSGVLVFPQSWPSQARTILGDHQRLNDTYFSQYPGYYFTGDGCEEDADGYVWISGRVDDVITKAGHRLGTAEIESALTQHPATSEAAVVPVPHPVKGQSIVAFVMLKDNYQDTDEGNEELVQELRSQVRKAIGGLAVPDHLHVVNALPKTRSGKIMRRILRKLVEEGMQGNDVRESLGDISTLTNPEVVDDIFQLTFDVAAQTTT